MKHLKTLALAAVAAGALMAFVGAGTASASKLCSVAESPCPAGQSWPAQELEFTLSSGTSALLKETNAPGGEGETLDTCKSSTLGGSITNTGSSTATVTGTISTLTWGTCTFPTTTTLKGGLEVHNIAGTFNGTVTADGETRVTINTIFFGSCTYALQSGESIGDITEGNPAVLHANAVLRSRSIQCPMTAVWTATYTLTKPSGTTLAVTAS